MFVQSLNCRTSHHFGTYYAGLACIVIDSEGADKFIGFITDKACKQQGDLLKESTLICVGMDV